MEELFLIHRLLPRLLLVIPCLNGTPSSSCGCYQCRCFWRHRTSRHLSSCIGNGTVDNRRKGRSVCVDEWNIESTTNHPPIKLSEWPRGPLIQYLVVGWATALSSVLGRTQSPPADKYNDYLEGGGGGRGRDRRTRKGRMKQGTTNQWI